MDNKVGCKILSALSIGFIRCVIIYDSDNKAVDFEIEESNDIFETITGIDSIHSSGKVVSQIFTEKEKSDIDIFDIYYKTIESGNTLKINKFIKNTEKWYEISAFIEMNKSFIIIFKDIDDYKKSEDTIKIMSSIDDIIFEMDSNYVFLNAWTNDESKLFVPRSEFQGKCIKDVFPENFSKIFVDGIDEALSNKKVIVLEYQSVNDEQYWNARITPLKEEINKVIILISNITEKKKTELLLKENEELFMTIFDMAPVGIAFCTTEGNYIKVNKKFCEITSYTEEELYGKRFIDITISEDLEMQIRGIKSLLNNEFNSFTMKKRYLTKDKKMVWVNLTMGRINLKTGLHLIGVIEDINEKVENEFYINKLISAIEQTNDSIVITDEIGKVEYVNRKFSEISGFSLDDIKDKSFNKYLINSLSNEVIKEIEEKVSIGEVWIGEITRKIDNGELFVDNISVTPVKNDAGKIVNYIIVSKDITEKIKNIEEHRINEERLESLLYIDSLYEETIDKILKKGLSEAIKLTKSGNGVIYYKNRAGEEYIYFELPKNYTDKEIPNPVLKNKIDLIKEITHKRDTIMNNPEYEKYIEDLPEIYLNLKRFISIPLENYSELFLILANKDQDYEITDLRQAKLMLEGIKSIVDKKDIETELKNEIEIAEKASRIKGEFISNMSHELRTPLNGIIGFSEYLSGKDLGSNINEIIKMMNESSHRLLNLINDVFNFSEISDNKVIFKIEKTETESYFRNIESYFADLIKKSNKEILFIFNLDYRIKEIIYIDQNKIRDLLEKIIENAVKFSENGGIITLNIRNDQINNNYIEFEVSDNGCGIDEETMKHIYEPFEQGENYLIKKHSGVGIGLAIVKKCLDNMNGYISIDSKKDSGTKVYFSIPAVSN